MSPSAPKSGVAIFFAVVLVFGLAMALLSEAGLIRTTYFELDFLALPPAAFLAVLLASGWKEAWAFFKKTLKVRLDIRWYIFAFLLFPIIGVITMVVSHLVFNTGTKLDWYHFESFQWWLFLIIVLVSVGDEVAWFSYGLTRVQRRLRPLVAAHLIGVVWAGWYIPRILYSDMAADNSIPLPLFFLHFVAMAPLCAWVYRSTQSGLVLIIMQVSANYAFLVMPILPQAAGNWYPFAVKVAVMAVFWIALFWWFGPQLKFDRSRLQLKSRR